MRKYTILFVAMTLALFGWDQEAYGQSVAETGHDPKALKAIHTDLPIIGLLAYEGVLLTEVTAPLDVFVKKDINGKEMFNVIVIAETEAPIVSEEGLRILPDYTFKNTPNWRYWKS